VPRRGVLGSPYTGSCRASILTAQNRRDGPPQQDRGPAPCYALGWISTLPHESGPRRGIEGDSIQSGRGPEPQVIAHEEPRLRSDASKKAAASTTKPPRTRAPSPHNSWVKALKHLPFAARFDTNPSQQRETSRNISSSGSACLRGSCNNHERRKTNRLRLKIMVSPVRSRVPLLSLYPSAPILGADYNTCSNRMWVIRLAFETLRTA
jgi:hypothetical protein